MMAIQSLCSDDCIDEVIDKYSCMVYRLAYAQTRNRPDAEDVYQDVFLRYISKQRTFESEEHRKAWLLRVTINRSRSVLGAWFRRNTVPLDETFEAETKEEYDFSKYLALLPQKYRPVIHLFYHEQLSVRQISTILGAKESTVRTWLTRARTMLGDKLSEGGVRGG